MMKSIPVKIKPLYRDVNLPSYATEGSAGFDIIVHGFRKYYPSGPNPGMGTDPNGDYGQAHPVPEDTNSLLLPPHSRLLVGSGFAVSIPKGYEIQVRSRSGVALKSGLVVLNSPGTIDSDYRGEIGAIICNTSSFAVMITKGERIAQCVVNEIIIAQFEQVDELDETDRGEGGFGSTGK